MTEQVMYVMSSPVPGMENSWVHCIAKDFTKNESGILLIEIDSKLIGRYLVSDTSDLTTTIHTQGSHDIIHYIFTGTPLETYSSVEFEKLKRNEYVKYEC
jgi:hypothetical protein